MNEIEIKFRILFIRNRLVNCFMQRQRRIMKITNHKLITN